MAKFSVCRIYKVTLWLNFSYNYSLNLLQISHLYIHPTSIRGHVLAFREKRRHIAYRIPFVFFFPKISALHTQKGPLYQYYHVLSISFTK